MNDEKKIEEQAAQALISNTEEIAESGCRFCSCKGSGGRKQDLP